MFSFNWFEKIRCIRVVKWTGFGCSLSVICPLFLYPTPKEVSLLRPERLYAWSFRHEEPCDDWEISLIPNLRCLARLDCPFDCAQGDSSTWHCSLSFVYCPLLIGHCPLPLHLLAFSEKTDFSRSFHSVRNDIKGIHCHSVRMLSTCLPDGQEVEARHGIHYLARCWNIFWMTPDCSLFTDYCILIIG